MKVIGFHSEFFTTDKEEGWIEIIKKHQKKKILYDLPAYEATSLPRLY